MRMASRSGMMILTLQISFRKKIMHQVERLTILQKLAQQARKVVQIERRTRNRRSAIRAKERQKMELKMKSQLLMLKIMMLSQILRSVVDALKSTWTNTTNLITKTW